MQAFTGGYLGRILRVNLTTKQTSVEELQDIPFTNAPLALDLIGSELPGIDQPANGFWTEWLKSQDFYSSVLFFLLSNNDTLSKGFLTCFY